MLLYPKSNNNLIIISIIITDPAARPAAHRHRSVSRLDPHRAQRRPARRLRGHNAAGRARPAAVLSTRRLCARRRSDGGRPTVVGRRRGARAAGRRRRRAAIDGELEPVGPVAGSAVAVGRTVRAGGARLSG